nr:hypothetical protein [Tanacetum cinerariifolium]
LEDITYSGDEEDVGAEADFTNLETTITVSHIPTTRVHLYLNVSCIKTVSNKAVGRIWLCHSSRGKKPEFEGRKPESEVHVSPSSSAQTKKHDDKTKREAKGKSLIESSTGYRNLSIEFEDFSDNSINEVNAVDSPVPAVGQISTNSTNTFSAAGPSNTAVSPTHGKSSYMNTSQYPNYPNMLELEDITYSGDEEDVGAEADFTNLETTITVSHIPTTRVHLYLNVSCIKTVSNKAVGRIWLCHSSKFG